MSFLAHSTISDRQVRASPRMYGKPELLNEILGKLFVEEAEQRALWSFLSRLEATLVEPFQPNYLDIVAKAPG
jgi:hypothetical protein